ncbi:MAG: hypothetical protein AVDCRST_MAG29-2120 [uncultured Nocardioidaceae bacterium]|uniref:Uncharacterized protein n=1 Tax=uncultured Nocardioidaceae bacterium TaxID=253824 RepID=A0A6J4M596_9ACTN|nr:MAG: hypothetical protein AVDCRST_MAG29-2120 [uncultured Nocardioidaceae bacterium]
MQPLHCLPVDHLQKQLFAPTVLLTIETVDSPRSEQQ